MVTIQTSEASTPSSHTPLHTIYCAALIHSLSLKDLEVLPKAVICVDQHGVIEWTEEIGVGEDVRSVMEKHDLSEGDAEVVHLEEGFVSPGFIDTHTHAPQYLNNGLGSDLQLLDWLDQFTFPTEARFKDVDFAGKVYRDVVDRSLNAGTTTSCYYATLHEQSTNALTDICHESGQRAFVGKCCMDRNSPPTYIEPSSSESFAATKRYLAHFDTLPSPSSSSLPPLVQPILTPRFAISCTPELLSSIGELAHTRTPSIAIQTHMSENPKECSFTKELFKDEDCGTTYAGVYEKYGLLGDGTILAHCVHLDNDEREVIRRNGAGVSHCPGSNLFLNSGAARIRDLLTLDIKVGLGTDCSGGPAISILSAIRSASHVSRFLSFTDPSYSPFTTAELFYLATIGGAKLCRLDDRIGNLSKGKEFDALWIRPRSPGVFVTPPVGQPSETTDSSNSVRELWEKWVWCGDDRDIGHVWVRGRRVGGAEPAS